MTEDKVTLSRKRVELIAVLTQPSLSPENRKHVQDELSILNAKLKALNTTEAVHLKAAADRRKAAGLAEAKANAARARANAGISVQDEDDDPGQTKVIETWIDDVLRCGNLQLDRARGSASIVDAIGYAIDTAAAKVILKLCDGVRAAARGQDLPLLWNGLCPAGKHGLDYEEQLCDLCAAEQKDTPKVAAPKKARKR